MRGPLMQQLRQAPIAHGRVCSPPTDWITVGSGWLVNKVLAESPVEAHHDWVTILGGSFVSYVTAPPPSFFECASCFD
jgi:hypothetical protein